MQIKPSVAPMQNMQAGVTEGFFFLNDFMMIRIYLQDQTSFQSQILIQDQAADLSPIDLGRVIVVIHRI